MRWTHRTAHRKSPETTAVGADRARRAAGARARIALSPLNRRRWQNFKANRRGYWSFWIFLVLFVVSLFAEFIANDKPFFVSFDGKSYFPVLVTYPETAFGGDFETAADYRDPYLQKLIADKGGYDDLAADPLFLRHAQSRPADAGAVAADLDADRSAMQAGGREARACTGCRDLEYNWLGTDDQGRDVLARLIYGFRISVLFGLILTIVSSIIGVAAGAVQGYFGGWTDLLFQRFIEIWTSMPVALSAADHLVGAGAGLLRAARHPAAVLLGVAGRTGARRIPARPQFRIHPGGARARRVERASSCSAICCRTRWWRP